MQAITQDIIVSQAVSSQLTNLQLSQDINNPQKASSVSFEEMVNSINNQKSEKTENKEAPAKVEESEKVEKVEAVKEEKTDKTSETKESSEKSAKTTEVKEKVSSEKKEVKTDSKIQDSKEKKVAAKKESAESVKLKKDLEKLDELLSKAKIVNEENSDNSSAELSAALNLAVLEKNAGGEQTLTTENLTSENELALDVEAVKEDDFLLKGNVREPKISSLDKDGKIKVTDFRTEKDESNVEKKDVKFSTEMKFDSKDSATFTVNLDTQVAEENILSLNSQTAASDGSNFQAMLNNQIQNNIPEFVKAGNIILKDNDQGTINLVLHPDDLGNVKIHLTLDGKSVSAQITVATKEAMEVFKDNAEALREAFVKSGFDTADFNVAFNNSGASNQNSDFEQNLNSNSFIAKKMYEGNSGSAPDISGISEESSYFSNYSINIVA